VSVQVAPASTANLAAGDGAAAAPAAAGARPQIETGRAGGRICVKPKLRKIEADTVLAWLAKNRLTLGQHNLAIHEASEQTKDTTVG